MTTEITFYGSSFIADPTGDKVAEAGRDGEAVLTATFDLDDVRRDARLLGPVPRPPPRPLWPAADARRHDARAPTLRRNGMRMPAESAAHERTVMCWPARQVLYGDLMPAAEAAHALVARTIARYEPVTMIAAPGAGERAAAACGRRPTASRSGDRDPDRRLVVPGQRPDLRRRTAIAGSPSTGCSTRGARSSCPTATMPRSRGATPSTPATRR